MSEIRITVEAGRESVTACLRDWRGESLDASHVTRIHETVDRALSALHITPAPSEPADHAHPR